MKLLYTLAFAIFSFTASFAAPVISVASNGSFKSVNTWDLGRLPQSGDTVVIPAGRVLTVDDNQNIGITVYVKIYGTLRLFGGGSKLNIGASSIIVLFDGATITGSNNNSQVITIGTNTVFNGLQSDLRGPMYATVSTTGFIHYNESPLPVKFVGFSVVRKGADVLVQWSTSEEINAYTYELERSSDGARWSRIAVVAAAGNSSVLNHYSYTDAAGAGRNAYYRIRQVDLDGKFTYTAIKSYKSGSAAAAVGISASAGRVVLQFNQEVRGAVTLRFVSLGGQVLSEQRIEATAGQVVVPAAFKGACVVAISNTSGIQAARQVLL